MEIEMSKQIGIGNFGDHADGTQKTAAVKFARIVKKRLREYCEKNYPDSDLKFDLSVEPVSGCTYGFDCSVGEDYSEETRAIEIDITDQYEAICADLDQSGEIYED
jgi:hypothetical protein